MIPLTENILQNLLVEVCRSLRRYLNSYKTLFILTTSKKINSLSNTFRCGTCVSFFPSLVTLKDLQFPVVSIRNMITRKMLTSSKKLFHKIIALRVPYEHEQKLFEILAVFVFESVCVKEETYKETDATKWIGKQVPLTVSIS